MQCASQYEWELYLDGEQPSMRREKLREHLAECPSCSEIVESLNKESRLFAEALAATPLPPDLEDYIKQRLTLPKHEGGRLIWFILPVIALAGVMMALYYRWSMIEQLWAMAGFLANWGMLLQIFLAAAKYIVILAGSALRGQPLLPSLTILILIVFWLRIKLLKGGRVHV